MNAHDSPWIRNIARAVVFCLLGSTLVQSAQAATIPLADVPLQVQNTSKANIMYTVDDSTSMANDFLPDYTVLADNTPTNSNNQFCRDGNGAGPAVNTSNTSGVRCGSQGNASTPGSMANLPPTLAAGFNHLYYNPLIVYIPPVGTNGNYYPSMTANNTGGPVSPWTKVYKDNWWTYATTALPTTAAAGNRSDLSQGFSVSRWCNTEWPKGLVNPASAADPAWDNPDFCRVTGYAYASASAAPISSGAPAVPVDYNYPFHDQNAATPDPASFYRTSTVMYCDGTKMNTTNSCTPLAVGDGHCLAGQCESISNPCTGGYTPYSPLGCNTNPLYGSPGPCVGSECLPCGGHACLGTTPSYACSTPTTVKVTGCTTVIAAGPSAGLTYIADANNPTKGNVCRHAWMTYSTAPNPAQSVSQYYGGAAPYTTQTGNCGNVPAKTVPRHYYKTTTLWCNAFTTATTYANLWKGYGTGTLGTQCQTSRDGTHVYPKFIEYLGQYTGHDNNYPSGGGYPAFQRCDLIVSTSTATCLHHLYWDPVSSSIQPMTLQTWDDTTHSLIDQGVRDRTFAEEMENYANWYAYYRTRILATKTVSSIAFKGLDQKVRVGYHTLSNAATTFVNIQDFTPAQKTTWYTALLNNTTIVTNPARQTPSLDALVRIGEYFRLGNGTVGPLTGATDPINLSCQRNYHILFTDGATNQAATAVPAAGNVDNVVNADLPVHEPYNSDPMNIYGQCYNSTAPCNATFPKAWPKVIAEGAVKADTLSDIALKYWMTDLRCVNSTDPLYGCAQQPYAASVSTNNVGSWAGDPAYHQHLNFSALSLGAQGTLPGDDQVATINSIITGPTVWPTPNPPNKPAPAGPAIDDLWHATINGFGHFVNANDPQDLQFGLGNILSEVANQPGSRSGVAFSSVNLATPNSASIYSASFAPHWGGSLVKATIDPVTATYTNANVWDAATVLTTQLTPGVAPHTTPWYDRRVVMTRNGATAISFELANLSGAQATTLGANAGIQQRVVDYLRGSSAGEGQTRGRLRFRYGNFLGDIVNAQLAIVSPTPIDPGTGLPVPPVFYEASNYGYAAFSGTVVTAPLVTRFKRIYAAANDGMVHSFRDDVEVANGVTYPAGSEAWAYIPSMLIRNSTLYVAGLQSLVYQEGGNPPFQHHFLVDATPRQFPADLNNCGSNTACTPDWRTMLVGGLGKGGQGYYALDVTTPYNPHDVPTAGDLTAAGTRILWEFTNGATRSGRPNTDNRAVTSMGYSYGRPLITKIRAFGWVAVLTSGYNNQTPDLPAGDGASHLYFVDIRTGEVLRTLDTPATAPANYGLAQISGFVKDWHEQTTEQIYGGDLTGRLWRFDVHDPNPTNWTVTLLATLDDGASPQPVTSAPQIEVDLKNGIDRWVFIGTGKLLDPTDLSSVQQQTLYAFRDGTVNQYETVGLPLTRAILGVSNEVSGLAGLPALPVHGWYDDIGAGENIVVDVQAELNVVAYVGTKPGTDPCLTGQPATIYAREFTKGSSVLTSGGLPAVSWTSASGAVGIGILSLNTARGGTLADPLLPPTLKGAVTQATDGKIVTFDLSLPSITGAHRMSWRIIGQ